MMSRVTWGFVAAGGLALAIGACGGSTGTNGPSPATPPSTPPGAVSTTTITIANNVATPKDIIVPIGSQVTFVNNDNRSHEMASDPHPQHGSCPSMEAGLGTITAGQTKVTHNFGNAGTCGFHDHLDASNSGFLGTIVVQ